MVASRGRRDRHACTQGMDLLSDYDYIAIFDADFKPEPDFLVRA